MKKILIVHDGDSDGRTAAALFVQTLLLLKLLMVKSAIEKIDNNNILKRASVIEEIQLFETRSRDSIEWMKHVDSETVIVILDLTFRLEHFRHMLAATDSVFVVDHHEGYEFGYMDAHTSTGFGKCWLPEENRAQGEWSDKYFMIHYSVDNCTTGLVNKMYRDTLTSAMQHSSHVQERMLNTNLKVYMTSRYESRLVYEETPPDMENFFLDPTWLPNKEFIAHVVDFDLNRKLLVDSSNFDAGLRALLDDRPKNNMWDIYHMLFRNSFLTLGKTFLKPDDLFSGPDDYLRVGDIINTGKQDLKDYVESLNQQIHFGPKYIQMNRQEGDPDMGTFLMLKCSKYQTQIGEQALAANPGFSFAIMHYEEDGYEKLSFRRNFDPKYGHVNLKALAAELGMMICGEERGGGHPGAAGLRLTIREFTKFCEFVQRTCQPVKL